MVHNSSNARTHFASESVSSFRLLVVSGRRQIFRVCLKRFTRHPLSCRGKYLRNFKNIFTASSIADEDIFKKYFQNISNNIYTLSFRGNGINLRPVVCNDSLGRPLKGILKNNQVFKKVFSERKKVKNRLQSKNCFQCSTLPRQSCSCGWGLADEDLHQGGQLDLHQGGHLDLHSTGLAPPLPPPPLPDSSPGKTSPT